MYRSSEVGEERRRLQTVPPTAFHRVARNSMEGVKDVQSGYVRAGPQGMYGRGHEHPGGCSGVRTASRYGAKDADVFSASRIPSRASAAASEAGAVHGVIDRILDEDLTLPKKQRHTAKRIYDRLRDEYGFTGKYTIVKAHIICDPIWQSLAGC